MPGFPNSFSILAPYGWNGTSYFARIETQMRHIVRLLEEARRRGSNGIRMEPRVFPSGERQHDE